ncbi:ROK family protein [Agrobacterium pusense]|uniref:ROK family protein n=1 Tax=Agrobacterium pusense TaxID=648995 RepID=UPI003FD335B8
MSTSSPSVGGKVVAAALAGDELATEVLYEAGVALGEAAAMLTSVLDPERIVFTGGLMRGAGDLLFEPARAAFLRRLAPPNMASKDLLEVSSATTDPIVFGAGNRASQIASSTLLLSAYPYR